VPRWPGLPLTRKVPAPICWPTLLRTRLVQVAVVRPAPPSAPSAPSGCETQTQNSELVTALECPSARWLLSRHLVAAARRARRAPSSRSARAVMSPTVSP